MDVLSTDVPSADVPSADIPSADVPSADVPSTSNYTFDDPLIAVYRFIDDPSTDAVEPQTASPDQQ